jgi:hypothetical protein
VPIMPARAWTGTCRCRSPRRPAGWCTVRHLTPRVLAQRHLHRLDVRNTPILGNEAADAAPRHENPAHRIAHLDRFTAGGALAVLACGEPPERWLLLLTLPPEQAPASHRQVTSVTVAAGWTLLDLVLIIELEIRNCRPPCP